MANCTLVKEAPNMPFTLGLLVNMDVSGCFSLSPLFALSTFGFKTATLIGTGSTAWEATLNIVPEGPSKLASLNWNNTEITDEGVQRFVKLCPVLSTLKLNSVRFDSPHRLRSSMCMWRFVRCLDVFSVVL